MFRSTSAELRAHHAELPFAVVPDPSEALYAEFGVASGWSAVLNPRTLPHGLRALLRGLPRWPAWPLHGKGTLGLPGDFLIAPDGKILQAHIGKHAYDQWSADEVLRYARQAHSIPPDQPIL